MNKSRACAALLWILPALVVAGCGSAESPAEPTTGALPKEDVSGTEPDKQRPTPWTPQVRAYTEQFYRGELDELHKRFSDELKSTLPRERLDEIHRQILAFGPTIEIVGEDSQSRGEYTAFARWTRYEGFDGVVELQWILRDDGTIAGFFVRGQPNESEPASP